MSVALVNVDDVIERNGVGAFQTRVLVFSMLLAILDGFDNLSLGLAAPSLSASWGIKPAELAPAFTAGLFGLTIGALVIGLLGDKFGRRNMALLSTLLFGAFTLTIPFSSSVRDLILMRFLAGLGIGGLLPNLCALTAEYSPRKYRATAVMIVSGAIATGAVIGGLCASYFIPRFGWQSIFYIAGGMTLLVALGVIVGLPESLRYLVVKGGRERRVMAILRKVAPTEQFGAEAKFAVSQTDVISNDGLVKQLFSDGRGPMTVLLWIVYIIELMIVYLFFFWMPTLIKQAGFPLETAILVTTVFNIGGVIGSFLLGPISIRLGTYITSASTFVLTAIASAVVANAGDSTVLLLAGAFTAGWSTLGGLATVSAIAADSYPTAIRSTGVGWASGAGRAGSMASPALVGAFLSLGWTAKDVLTLPIAPTLMGAACVILIAVFKRKQVRSNLVVPIPS